jgi:hypothetical protein
LPSRPPASAEQWLAEVEGRGKRVTGEALRPASEAVTVKVSLGQVLVTDGPFAEAKEWIAGFDILECDNLDEAIAIAARHPQANGANSNYAGSGMARTDAKRARPCQVDGGVNPRAHTWSPVAQKD